MKDPAFLFYSSDFLSGTMLMSDEQIGQYIKLLCLQHQKGHLKEKDMLNICKTYDEDIFSKFKKDKEGNYYNERLDSEIQRRKKYSESRRNNRNNVDNSNTCIYLIYDKQTGLTKIGSSNNPERRLVELKNQYKNNKLVLLAYVENVEQKLETKLHEDYKEKNKVNEWFELSKEEIDEIININNMKTHMNNHMIKDMNNHMIEDMNNHMTKHMGTETTTTTKTININNIKNKLQKRFLECTGTTNLNAISECISYLDDLPYEVIEKALLKASEKDGRLEICKDYITKLATIWNKNNRTSRS